MLIRMALSFSLTVVTLCSLVWECCHAILHGRRSVSAWAVLLLTRCIIAKIPTVTARAARRTAWRSLTLSRFLGTHLIWRLASLLRKEHSDLSAIQLGPVHLVLDFTALPFIGKFNEREPTGFRPAKFFRDVHIEDIAIPTRERPLDVFFVRVRVQIAHKQADGLRSTVPRAAAASTACTVAVAVPIAATVPVSVASPATTVSISIAAVSIAITRRRPRPRHRAAASLAVASTGPRRGSRPRGRTRAGRGRTTLGRAATASTGTATAARAAASTGRARTAARRRRATTTHWN